ncbi:MAG: hypothetical protein KF832_30425 [Caldilineaceae bacterium]|nr:hypothetical protein [Caldilineaceae bacterium]
MPYFLSGCMVFVLLLSLLDSTPVLARYPLRDTNQVLPFSPLTTTVTSTQSAITPTLPLTAALLVTSPLVVDAVAPTVTLTSPLTIPLTSPLAVPLTSSLTITQPTVPVVEFVNRGQTSLLLVSAVFGGLLLVAALVLGRSR